MLKNSVFKILPTFDVACRLFSQTTWYCTFFDLSSSYTAVVEWSHLSTVKSFVDEDHIGQHVISLLENGRLDIADSPKISSCVYSCFYHAALHSRHCPLLHISVGVIFRADLHGSRCVTRSARRPGASCSLLFVDLGRWLPKNWRRHVSAWILRWKTPFAWANSICDACATHKLCACVDSRLSASSLSSFLPTLWSCSWWMQYVWWTTVLSLRRDSSLMTSIALCQVH